MKGHSCGEMIHMRMYELFEDAGSVSLVNVFIESIHPHVNHFTTTVTFHIYVQTSKNTQPLFLFYFNLAYKFLFNQLLDILD